MKRIKVCYLITGLYIGGAEKLLLALVRHLNRSRFEPVVITLVGGDMLEDYARAGVRVHDLGMRHKLDLGAVVRLRRLLLAERPDVVHTHLFHADLLGRVVARWCQVPAIVTTFHMVEAIRHRWLIRMVDRWAARLNHALIAVSEEVRQGIARVEGIDPSRIEVIPNAVEAAWPDRASCERLRRTLGLPSEGPLLGLVSRLEAPRKGHRVLFEAVRQLAARWPTLRCLIVGDGPDRAQLESQARRLGVADRVRFVGMRSDVETWLGLLDVFAFPSLHEGLPMAVIEAMAAACPIVSTRVGGIEEILTDGEHGVLVPSGDPDALAAGIERLLRDPALARALGRAARERFQGAFDIRHRIRCTEALYERLANAMRPPRLKLLEVVTCVDAGGVTTYLANLIRSWPRERVEVSLASGTDRLLEGITQALGVRHHRVSLCKSVRPLKDLCALWQLWRLMRRERFTLVHTNMCKADAIGALAARLAGVPCVVSTAHGPLRVTAAASLIQAVFDGIERAVYRLLHHRVISVSDATTRELLLKRKVRPGQVVTIPNGIEASRFRSATRRKAVRRALGLRPDQPVLIMVGRLSPPKAPGLLVRSMRELSGRWPDAVCLLVGDGEQADALARMIRAEGLDAAVRLMGRRGDVPALLAAADLFVLATFSEGMPISVLEAMAAGLPVVASRVSGMDELVEDGRTGWLVPPGDAAAQAEAIDAALRDPARRRQMGEAALERIRRGFDLQRHADRTLAALVEVVDAHRAHRPACRRAASRGGWRPLGLRWRMRECVGHR